VPLNDDTTGIIRVLLAYHSAMVDASTDDLNTILDEEFSLVHITVYVQSKHEWFGVIRSGQFDYQSIRVDQKVLSVTVSGTTGIAAGRGIFDASINGMRRPWRLQFAIRLAKHGDARRIVEARYTTF
jgi:Domain of unknown function (DUF4440)